MADRKDGKGGKKPPRKNYEVGYGKPPKWSQFKPGQCGNLKGRPRGSEAFETILLRALRSRVTITQNGKARRVSAQEAMILRQLEKALKGDAKALAEMNRLACQYNVRPSDEPTKQPLSEDDKAIIERHDARIRAAAKKGSSEPDRAPPKRSRRATSKRPGKQRPPAKRRTPCKPGGGDG